MFPCRAIVDPPQDGAWNMALDEALLEDAANRGAATLRFYQWREPTLSLGYFQSYRERFTHAASRDISVVRRLSGGGALLHDRELTYSLCLPATHPLARQSEVLYQAVHQAAIRVAAQWNLQASLVGKRATAESGDEPFLCFARRTAADVVLTSAGSGLTDAKIIGSAQRRRRGAVLQHGALLLGTSHAAPELVGMNDLSGRSLTAADVVTPWQEAIAADLKLELKPVTLSSNLRETAQQFQTDKYSARSWTERR
jgi:lipoate-protein ligase A